MLAGNKCCKDDRKQAARECEEITGTIPNFQLQEKYAKEFYINWIWAKEGRGMIYNYIVQGINQRATDMQDTAKSFSSMANQLLRTAEHGKRN